MQYQKGNFSMGGQDVWCEEREPVVLGRSDLEQIDRVFNLRSVQSQKGFIWGGSIGFVVWLESVQYQEGHICIMRKGCAVQGEKVCDRVLHLEYEERVCNVRGVCSIRRVTSAVQGQGLHYKLERVWKSHPLLILHIVYTG